MTVVLAIRKAVLVICITVLNDTNSCVSDMTVVLAIRTVNVLRSAPKQSTAMNRIPSNMEKNG